MLTMRSDRCRKRPRFSLTRDGVLVVVAVLGVVLEHEVLEGLAEVDLLRLLEAERDHGDARRVPGIQLSFNTRRPFELLEQRLRYEGSR